MSISQKPSLNPTVFLLDKTSHLFAKTYHLLKDTILAKPRFTKLRNNQHQHWAKTDSEKQG